MSENPRPRLYLIDGYSNIFRAYYAIRELSNSKGEPTNAVFGFLNMLRKLLREEAPEHVGVAFDVSSDTVRRDQYEDYKANRAPMPEDLRPQIPWIRKVLDGFKIPILELPKYEADDVLGTLAKKASSEGYEVVILSPDKDLMQLVDEHVYVYHTRREKLYDRGAVEEEWGVPPERLVDVLALMGDSSDNVPGVPGIGRKGAEKLVREIGPVEELLERAEEVSRKSYREGLQEHREQALQSKELVTIHTDLPVDFEPERLVREEPDWPALIELCRELEFTSVLKDFEAEHGGTAEPVAEAEEALDTEKWAAGTAGLGPEVFVGRLGGDGLGDKEPLGLAVAGREGPALYADFRREGLREAALGRLGSWLGDAEVTVVGHDLKEVLRLLGERGSVVRARLFDTLIGAYLLRPDQRDYSLEAIASDRLAHSALGADAAGWAKGTEPALGSEPLLAYAAERAVLPRRLAGAMREELETRGLEEIYGKIEAPLLPVLLGMEERGVDLDVEYLGAMSEELGAEIGELEEEIYEIAGERFNLNSPKQLGTVMFEKLGYPAGRKTAKTKSYSTNAETLEELSSQGYPLAERILRYRELTKLKSTYVDALPALVADDGRLHTRFNQAVAATGRLSSANPNLQNIPIRTELGHRIRKAFRAPEGRRLVVADYSQIELRILAHIAGEGRMREAFQAGEDIHAATAAAVFRVAPELVNSEQRRMAKVINFGIIYGMSSYGLARRLGIARKDAQLFIDAYMEQYPGVASYTEETLESAYETGKVETLLGRIRWLPDIKSKNYGLRENAKRMAINARIQGTAADLLKLAMIAVDRRLKREQPESQLLLTVHDELVLEAPAGEVEAVSALLVEEMEGVAELDVPLVVEVGSGPTWYEAKG